MYSPVAIAHKSPFLGANTGGMMGLPAHCYPAYLVEKDPSWCLYEYSSF